LFASNSYALYQILASGGEARPATGSTAPQSVASFLPVRGELSSSVAEAVKRVFVAKESLDAAKKDNQVSISDLTALALALEKGRKAESRAVDDLHRHKNTHGC
jgi:hypothetical protein